MSMISNPAKLLNLDDLRMEPEDIYKVLQSSTTLKGIKNMNLGLAEFIHHKLPNFDPEMIGKQVS